MTVIELLRQQFKSAHEMQEGTVADVTAEMANFNNTNKALPVGAAYAHSVISEDVVLKNMLEHKTPLSADKTDIGLSAPMPSFSEWDKHEEWIKTVQVDIPTFKKFAEKVYKATDDYLANLKEEELTKELDLGPMGKNTVINVINNFILLHIANLTGEISSVKGLQGFKGYPF